MRSSKKKMKKVYLRAAVLIAIGIIGIAGLVLVENGTISERPRSEKVPNLVGMKLDKAAIMMYSSAAKGREPKIKFVVYEEGKSPAECEPADVDTERLENYTVMDMYPEARAMYKPGKDTLYLAVEEI